MASLLFDLITLPIKFILALIELLGRTLAVIVGLGMFGFGAMLCLLGPFILIGAPICLLSAILVIKAL